MELSKPNASKLDHGSVVYEGVTVKRALKLIENSDFKDAIKNFLNVSKYEDDFIEIPGAKLLVDIVLKRENLFEKFDLDTEIKNIKFLSLDEENNLEAMIYGISDENTLNRIKKGNLKVKTVTQSIKSDLLDNFYSINKFANFCKENEYEDILKSSIQDIEKKQISSKRKLRLVESDSKYFLRGFITSQNYNDYNIPLSLFMTLIILHKRHKHNEESYKVESYKIGLSEINAVFTQSNKKEVEKDVFVSFGVELNNNEITNGSFSIKGTYNFSVSDLSVMAIPEKINTLKLFSIYHTSGIDKFKEHYLEVNLNIKKSLEIFFNSADKMKNLSDYNDILKFLENALENSNTINKETKSALSKRTNKSTVNTLFEFLSQLGYLEKIIASNDIQSLSYWRGRVYNTLFEKGN